MASADDIVTLVHDLSTAGLSVTIIASPDSDPSGDTKPANPSEPNLSEANFPSESRNPSEPANLSDLTKPSLTKDETENNEKTQTYSRMSEEVCPTRDTVVFQKKPTKRLDVRYVNEFKSLKEKFKLASSCDQQQCPMMKERLTRHQHQHHQIPKKEENIFTNKLVLRDQCVNVSPTLSRMRLPKFNLPISDEGRAVQTEITMRDFSPTRTFALKEINRVATEVLNPDGIPLRCSETREVLPSRNFYKEHLQNEILNWLQNVPMFYTMSFSSKDIKDNIVSNLAEKINDLVEEVNNSNYEIKTKVEIENCLNHLPMWLPGSKHEQTVFKDGLREKLWRKVQELNENFLGVVYDKPSEAENEEEQLMHRESYEREIINWSLKLQLNEEQPVNRRQIVDFIMKRLAPLLKISLHTTSYKLILKGEIIEILDVLPLTLTSPKYRTVHLNRFAEELANRLISVQLRNDPGDNNATPGRESAVYHQFVDHIMGIPHPKYRHNLRKIIQDKVKESLNKVQVCHRNDLRTEICATFIDSQENLRTGDDISIQSEICQFLRDTGKLSEERTFGVAKMIMKNIKEAIKDIKNTATTSFDSVIPELSGNVSVYRWGDTRPPATSTPKKQSKKEISKLNKEEKSYMDQVAGLIDKWMETLPKEYKEDKTFRNTIKNDLAGDIMDQLKVEQLAPETSIDRDKFLKYILYRWFYRYEFFDDDHIREGAKPFVEDFLVRLKTLDVPKLTAPQHGNRQAMANVVHMEGEHGWDDDYVPQGLDVLEDQISVWMNEQPSELYANKDKGRRDKMIHDLALNLQDHLRNKHPEDDIDKDISTWLKKVVKPKEKENIGLLTQDLKNKVIKLPQDRTLQAQHEDKKRQIADRIAAKKKNAEQPSAGVSDVSNLGNIKGDPDKSIREFVPKFIDRNYNVDDRTKAAFGQLLTTELRKLSPATQQEIFQHFEQSIPHPQFMPDNYKNDLEYIRTISDWLGNIPVDQNYNTPDNKDRIQFVTDLAKNVQEIEEQRKRNPYEMDYNYLIASVIMQSVHSYGLPIYPEYREDTPVIVDSLYKQIIALRGESYPAPAVPSNLNTSGLSQSLTMSDIQEQNLSDFIADYIRINGRDIAHDKRKLDAWTKNLHDELNKMIQEGADPSTLTKAQVHNRFADVPFPDDESLRRSALEEDYNKEITEWLKNLPLLPTGSNPKVKEDRNKRNRELAAKLAEIQPKRNADPNDNAAEKELEHAVATWISQQPLDPNKEIVVPVVISQLMNRMENVNKAHQVHTSTQPPAASSDSGPRPATPRAASPPTMDDVKTAGPEDTNATAARPSRTRTSGKSPSARSISPRARNASPVTLDRSATSPTNKQSLEKSRTDDSSVDSRPSRFKGTVPPKSKQTRDASPPPAETIPSDASTAGARRGARPKVKLETKLQPSGVPSRETTNQNTPQPDASISESESKDLEKSKEDNKTTDSTIDDKESKDRSNKSLKSEYSVCPAKFKGEDKSKRNPAEIIVEAIENWSYKLPIKGMDKAAIRTMKEGIARRLYQKIGELNVDSRIFNDDVLYKEMLGDEIDTQLENIPQNPDLQKNREKLKEGLLNTILDTNKLIKERSAGDNYKHKLETSVDSAIPYPVQNTQTFDPGFEMYKSRLADMFILENFDHSNDDVKIKYERRIRQEVDKYFETAQNKNVLPLTKDQLYTELYSALFKVPMPNESSVIDEVEQVKTRCVVDEWFERLPLKQPDGLGELLEWDKILSTLTKRIHEIEKHDPKPNKKILKEIMKWIEKLPLVQAQEGLMCYASQLQAELVATDDDRRYIGPSCCGPCSQPSLKNKCKRLAHMSTCQEPAPSISDGNNKGSLTPAPQSKSTTAKPCCQVTPMAKKKPGDIIVEVVEEWCNQLPLISNEDNNKIVRDNVSTRIIIQISELNIDPETFNDDVLYDELLDEELENVLSNIPVDNDFQRSKAARKYQLKEMIKAIKPLIKEEKARHEYKEELVSTIENILKEPQEKVEEKKFTYTKVKDDVIESFVQYTYAQDDEGAKQLHKMNLHDAVEKYFTEVRDKGVDDHVTPLVRRNQLLCELSKIPAPNDALREEMDEIKMRREVEHFFQELSISDGEEETKTKKNLSKRLCDIEKSGHNCTSEKKMKSDISRCLKKLKKDVNSKVIDDFVLKLKESEADRKTPPLPESRPLPVHKRPKSPEHGSRFRTCRTDHTPAQICNRTPPGSSIQRPSCLKPCNRQPGPPVTHVWSPNTSYPSNRIVDQSSSFRYEDFCGGNLLSSTANKPICPNQDGQNLSCVKYEDFEAGALLNSTASPRGPPKHICKSMSKSQPSYRNMRVETTPSIQRRRSYGQLHTPRHVAQNLRHTTQSPLKPDNSQNSKLSGTMSPHSLMEASMYRQGQLHRPLPVPIIPPSPIPSSVGSFQSGRRTFQNLENTLVPSPYSFQAALGAMSDARRLSSFTTSEEELCSCDKCRKIRSLRRLPLYMVSMEEFFEDYFSFNSMLCGMFPECLSMNKAFKLPLPSESTLKKCNSTTSNNSTRTSDSYTTTMTSTTSNDTLEVEGCQSEGSLNQPHAVSAGWVRTLLKIDSLIPRSARSAMSFKSAQSSG